LPSGGLKCIIRAGGVLGEFEVAENPYFVQFAFSVHAKPCSRIRGQVESIERSLTTDDDCADVLMLLANVRGGINRLMAEVLEDHIRLHLLASEKSLAPPHELAEDLIDLVRAYLK
jgi:DNA-binding FrmR family transcriptional regulator